MNNFKDYLLSKGHSGQVTDIHYRQLMYFLNWCEDQNIESEAATYREVLGYIQWMQKRGLKQRTQQHYLGSLRHYFLWLIKRKIREDNPVKSISIRGVKRRHLYHVLKMVELERLYHQYSVGEEKDKHDLKYLAGKRNKAMLGMMIYQGLGTAELQRLELKDVKLREGKIYVPPSRRSNGRELRLESQQVMDLMEYTLQVRPELLKLSEEETDRLFVAKSKGGGKLHNMTGALLRSLQEINPGVSSLQQIRSSVITHWLKHHNLREVQYMAGHRFVGSTEYYLVNDLDDLTEDIVKFHPIG